MNRKIMKSMGLVIIVTLSILTCQIFPNRDFPTVNSLVTPLTKDNLFDIQEKHDDYLVTTRGTEFLVRIESEQEFTAYNEYSVNVTVQLLAFGTSVYRIYDIFFDLSLVWSGGFWNSTIREVPEIDTIGVYEYTIFGIALNEGDFGPLADNEEVSMTLYYHIEVTEGVEIPPDDISEGLLSIYGITYVNARAVPVGGIFDLVLPPIYTNKESKMGISLRTNEEWKTNKAMTLIATLSAEEFPDDVDRFYEIQITIWFKSGGENYYISTQKEYGVYQGYPMEIYWRVLFDESEFGGFTIGEEKSIELWYDITFKEGVILGTDTENSVSSRYAYNIILKHEGEPTLPGEKESHILDLTQQILLSHVAAKSWIYNGANIYVNFTLFFAFNIYIEIEHEVLLDSYSIEEITTLDPFKLYMDLISNNADVSIGAQPILGCIIHWIDKNDLTEYFFSITDLPVPTPIDVDGDGSSITIMSKTVYLWDSPIWTNGTIPDTFGNIIYIDEGITIDVFDINLLEYIDYLFPGVVIPGWLLSLNFILAIHIYPIIYQLFYLSYVYSGAAMTLDDNGYYGFIDYDTTDTFDIDTRRSSTITPDTDPVCSTDCIPGVYTYSYSEIYGTIDVELEILSFSIFRFTLINLASDVEDSVNYNSYSSQTFTCTTNYIPPITPTPTPTPTPSPTPTPTESPTNTTTPITSPTAGYGLIISVIGFLIISPIILIIRRKRK
ncbi:MAG TPA: hypothetical protein VMX55_10460 [candidate division Zixibacteria bacterium]|nr:hypothetical protein [candidate division Zixibacteria bacterium]